MQNNLHISKKSSTFVADLGIVPTTTNKYNRVMKAKKVIFRAEGANRGLVHVVYVTSPKGNYYEVMKERKKVAEVSRYLTLTNAMQEAVKLCEKDIMKAIEGGLL